MNVPEADLPDEFRTWQLCSTFGWTILEADEQPAGRNDWLLAIDMERRKAKAEADDGSNR